MIYPWQQQTWQRLIQLPKQSRLPHALLFTGLSGIGKSEAAKHFIRSFLCQTQVVNAEVSKCCHACRLFAANTHPSVLQLEPEGKSQTIKIEHIRHAIDFVNQSSFAGEHRFVLINQADTMNISAANALLKTLEEPASGAIMLLIASQMGRLPATVVSRCQQVHFGTPDKTTALAWLKENIDVAVNHEILLTMAHGAPLHAKAWAAESRLTLRKEVFAVLSEPREGMIIACSSWADEEVNLVMDLMMSWVMDVVRIQLGADTEYLCNTDYLPSLQKVAAKHTTQAVLTFSQRLQWYRQQITMGFNLNKQLMFENLLIQWHGLT